MQKITDNESYSADSLRDKFIRTTKTVLATGLVALTGAGCHISESEEEHSSSWAQRQAEAYHAWEMEDEHAKNDFWDLTHMNPVKALTLMNNWGKRSFAQTLQTNLYHVSLGLRPFNGGSGANTNQYDLAHELIPQRTRTVLRNVGVRYIPVEPVVYWGCTTRIATQRTTQTI